MGTQVIYSISTNTKANPTILYLKVELSRTSHEAWLQFTVCLPNPTPPGP